MNVDMDAFAEVVGDEISALRQGTEMSRADMALESGFSSASMFNWETGRTDISLANFFVLCLKYGDHPSDVLRRIEQKMLLEY